MSKTKTKEPEFNSKSNNAKIAFSESRTLSLKKIKEQERLITLMKNSDEPDAEFVIASCKERIKEIKEGMNKLGAKKKIIDGIEFASTLEAYFYQKLKDNNITFVMQRDLELQPSFYLFGEHHRPIVLKIDFIVENRMFIDTKGQFTDKSKMKWKMLKYKYKEEYEYHLPHNQKECDNLIEWIIESR